MFRHHSHGPMLDLVRVAAPAEDLVGLDELKAHLRVDFDDDDDMIAVFGQSVTDHLDGFGGILGRALVEQTWSLSFDDGFPSPEFHSFARLGHRRHWRRLELPLPPLISVVSVAYVDTDGVDQVLAPDQYVVLEGPVAAIEPAYGLCWPATRRTSRAVTITFKAGYGAAEDVPAPLRAAVKLMVGDLYENRESVVINDSRVTLIESATFDRLITPYRVLRI